MALGTLLTEPGKFNYNDVTISATVSQITSLTIVYPTLYSAADQRKHESSTSLAFVRGIHRWPVNSLHKGPVTQKMFPFDDVIMRHQGQSSLDQVGLSAFKIYNSYTSISDISIISAHVFVMFCFAIRLAMLNICRELENKHPPNIC